MAEEKANKEDGKEETVSKKDLDALRAKLESRLGEANKAKNEAEGRLAAVESRLVGSQFDVKIPEQDEDGKGIDAPTKAALTGLLEKAKETERNLVTSIQYALQQKAEALSWEVAIAVEAVDDREEILTKIRSAKTPNDMEAVAREIRLEYKEAKLDSSKTEKEDSTNPGRSFADGQGKPSPNRNKALEKSIQDIDVNDTDAQKKLDALYEEVTALSR